MIAQHTLSAAVVADAPIELDPIAAAMTRDEDWAPYAQTTLTIVTPSDQTLARLDPRAPVAPRVALEFARLVGEQLILSALTDRWKPTRVRDLTRTLGPDAISELSGSYAQAWNPDGTETAQQASAVLWVRRRQVDLEAGVTQLTLTSGEALLLDYALVASATWRPPTASLRALVVLVLARIGHELAASDTPDVQVLYESTVWEPGVSAWEYLEPLLQVADRRLYCDEAGVWHLEPRLGVKPGNLALRIGVDAIVSATEGSDREDDWADSVVVAYKWQDDEGNDRIRYDLAQALPKATKTIRHEYSTPFPGAGAARRLLRRAYSRGRGYEATILSDYSVQPGQTVTLTSPSGPPSAGYLARTVWQWPDGLTTLGTRGLMTTPPNAWINVPAGLSWNDAPAGMSWREADQLVPDTDTPYAWRLVPQGLSWLDAAPGLSWSEADQLTTKEPTNG